MIIEQEHPTALLRADNLVRTFQAGREGLFGLFGPRREVRAVDGVSLAIMPGEALGLVGESGSGKSTVGNMISAQLLPTAGEVYFEGRRLHDESLPRARRQEEMRHLRRNLQVIFQDPAGTLNPRLPIGEQIAEPLRIHGEKDARLLKQRVAESLLQVGLNEDMASRYPHELSGGQRQRAVVARALITRPKLIVCDEPTSALDVSIQAQVVNLLGDLKAETGISYLFISHNLGVVRTVCDRVAVMYLGRIVEEAPVDELFSHPEHPYTRALLEANPIPVPGLRSQTPPLHGEPPSPLDVQPGCRFLERCPRAHERCRRLAPELKRIRRSRAFSEPVHLVACHYPETDRSVFQESLS